VPFRPLRRDEKHVELMLKFLRSTARRTQPQIIRLTYRPPTQVEELRMAGVHIVDTPGEHFL